MRLRVGWLALPGPVLVLLAGLLLMNAGYFMVIPLLAVYGTATLGLSAVAIGLVIGVLTAVQRGFGLVGGALAERFDRRVMLCVGLTARAVGFAAYSLASNLTGLLGATVLVAAGGALVSPLVPAALATLCPPEQRPQVFAARSAATNLAASLGPLLGAALLVVDARLAFVVAGVLHLLLLVAALRLPDLSASGARPGLAQVLRAAMTDGRFIRFGVAVSGFWLLQTQLLVGIPLRAAQLTGSQATAAALVSALFVVNGVTVIICQIATPALLDRLGSRQSFAVGTASCAVGLLLAGVLPDTAGLVVAVVVISVGESVALPALDLAVTDLAPEALLATYFGAVSLAWAVGGLAGSSLGGWLLEGDPSIRPWLLFAVIGAVVVLAALRWGPARQSTDLPGSSGIGLGEEEVAS